MTIEEITAKYFRDLDPGDGRTLHEILHEGAGKLIADLPDQAEFPSERSLADTLKVHRNTIRGALEPYIKSGLLKRNKRRTLVNRPGKTGDSFSADAMLHPLQLRGFAMSYAPPAPVTIKFVNYETMPSQRRFWQETVFEFEKQNPHIKVESEVPECFDFASYRKKIQEEKPDLFQLPAPYCVFSREYLSLLAEMPEDIFNAKDFFLEFYEDAPLHLKNICPVTFAPWLDFVNLELAERYQIDLNEFAAGQGLFSFASAGSHLPETIKLTSHYGALINSLGFPGSFMKEPLEQSSKERLTVIRNLLPRGESALFFRITHPFTWYQKELLGCFSAGRMVHISVSYPALLQTLERRCQFRTKSFLQYTASPGRRLHLGALELGIHAESRQQEAARLFLRHLLSPSIQRKAMNLTGNIPFRRSIAGEFCIHGGEVPHLPEYFSCYRTISERMMKTFWSGKISHDPYIRQVLDGTLSPEDGAALFAAEFQKKFPDYMDKNEPLRHKQRVSESQINDENQK